MNSTLTIVDEVQIPGHGPMMSQETTSSYRSHAREVAFEQLLRLAASFASTQPAITHPNGSEPVLRKSPFGENIAVRAYHIYVNRGATNGHDLDDWLQAEREVIEELKKKRASLRLALAFGVLKDFTEENP